MPVPDHTSTRTRRRLARGVAVTVLSLALGLAVLSPVAAGAADRTTTARPVTARAAASAPSKAFTTAIRSARASLTAAVVYLQDDHPNYAIGALRTFRTRLATVHQLGMTNMGPVKVVAVLGLEHQVAMKLLPPFNGLKSSTVVTALQTTLTTTFAKRTAMLKKVIAVPAEGPIDYTDALADTLPIYGAEVRAYTSALKSFTLTPQAKTALTKDLALVKATRQQFTRAFGGGE